MSAESERMRHIEFTSSRRLIASLENWALKYGVLQKALDGRSTSHVTRSRFQVVFGVEQLDSLLEVVRFDVLLKDNGIQSGAKQLFNTLAVTAFADLH